MTLNLTARRQDRRVSFAPSAQMREFTIDNGDDSISHSGTSPARAAPPSSSHQQQQPLILDISAAIAQASASLAVVEVGKQPSPRRRSSTSSRNVAGHRRRSSVANVAAMVESLTPSPTPSPNIEQESAFQPSAAAYGNTTMEDPDASSMNIVDSDQVTTAFRSQFVFPRTSLGGLASAVQGEDARDSFEDDGEDSNNNTEASGMVLADDDEGDVTSAFASNTHLFGSSAGRPRQSLAFPSSSTSASVPSPAAQPESTTSQASLPRRASYGLAPSPSKKVRAMQELAARRGSLPASAFNNNNNNALLFQDVPRAPAPALALSKSVPASTGSTSSTEIKGRLSLGFSFGPDRQVPLGNAGLDAEEAGKLRAEKAKRGSMAFYAASSSSSTSAIAGASSASASAIATTSTSTSTSIFAVHHTSNLDEDRHEEEGEGEGEQSEEMDMSIADTRRVSNVFARAFLAPEEEQDEEEESGEQQEYATGSPSPAKQQQGGGAGLYPSLSGLGFEAPTSVGLGFGSGSNSSGAARTEGQNALAFLDDDNNEEEEGQEDEDSWLAGREAVPEQQEQILQAGHQSTFTVGSDVGEAVVEPQIAAADDDHAQVENQPSMEEQDHAHPPEMQETEASPQQQIYHPLPDPVFVPRASRLSIVQERPLEEEEEEEDEESEKEGTRDMDITGVFGTQQSAPRRLSIAHPTSLKSPARTAGGAISAAASPGRSKIPITARRLSVSATPLGEKTLTPNTATATKSQFRAVTPLTAVPSSPAQNQGKDRQQLITGLTPNMKKLSDWSAGGSARKPISAAGTQRASSVALPPTSDGFNDFAPDASSRAHSEPLGAGAAANVGHENGGGGGNPIPGMSLDQFLGMADMQFMDGLLSVSQGAAVKSRSSGKKSLGGAGLDRSSAMVGAEDTREGETEAKEVTLTEQVVASGAVIPMMESLQMVSLLFPSFCERAIFGKREREADWTLSCAGAR